MSDCKDVRDLIQAQFDSGLSGEQTLQVRSHLEKCPGCVAFTETLRKVHNSLEQFISAEPTPPFEQLKVHQSGPVPLWKRIFFTPSFAGGLTFAVFILAFFVVPRGQAPEKPLPSIESAPALMTEFFLSQVHNTVSTGKSPDSLLPVPPNTKRHLEENALVRVDEKGEGVLFFEKNSLIQLKPGTDVLVLASSLKMKKGDIWVNYKGSGAKLQIETPSAVMGVLGTQFGVKVESDGATKVWCREGRVWVKDAMTKSMNILKKDEQVAVSAKGIISAVAPIIESTDPSRLGEDWMKKPIPVDPKGK